MTCPSYTTCMKCGKQYYTMCANCEYYPGEDLGYGWICNECENDDELDEYGPELRGDV